MGDASDGGWSLRTLLPGVTDHDDRPAPGLGGVFGRLRRAVTAVAFWVSIPLPFLYVPYLFSGLETQVEGLVFGALVVAHVAVLWLGYSYAPSRPDPPDPAERPRSAGGRPGD